MAEETNLTTKQAKAIPILLAAKSYEQGCEAAQSSKTCFYEWMQNEAFKTEFEHHRNELVEAAFGMIAQSIEKAVSTLVGLLDSSDERVKRLSANDIINHFLRHKELHELEKRIEAIEESLARRR